MPKEPSERQRLRAQQALEIYQEPASVRQVAERLEVSYGTAYTLIKTAGGQEAFRPRGTRIKPQE